MVEWKYAWIDIATLAVVGLAFYHGYKRGLINQAVWLGSFAVAYVVASRFCHEIAERLQIDFYSPQVTVGVVFVLVMVVIIVVLQIVARAISRVIQPTIVGFANAISGGVFTGLLAIVLMLVALNLALILWPELEDTLENTVILSHGARLIEVLMERTRIDELAHRVAL